jgi:hypothetical protein
MASHELPDASGAGVPEHTSDSTAISFSDLAESRFGQWVDALTQEMESASPDTHEQLQFLHDHMPTLVMRALRVGAADLRDKRVESTTKTANSADFWGQDGWRGSQQAILDGSLQATSGVLYEYYRVLADQQKAIQTRTLIPDNATQTMVPEPFSPVEEEMLGKILDEKKRIYDTTDILHVKFGIASPFASIVTERFFERMESLIVEESPLEVPTDQEFLIFFQENKKNAA